MIQEGTVEELPEHNNRDMGDHMNLVSFECKYCYQGVAECFICTSYGPIEKEDGLGDSVHKSKKLKACDDDIASTQEKVTKSVK